MKTPKNTLKVGDRVVSEANMPGTVLALRFGRLGEGAERVWIATVQWHGKHPSTSRYLAKRLRIHHP
jgi:hypothetical protein